MDQIKNELLHFTKGVGPHAFTQLLTDYVKDYKKWCPFISHKNKEEAVTCYVNNPRVKDLLDLCKKFNTIVKYLSSDSYNQTFLVDTFEELKVPERNIPREIFFENFNAYIDAVQPIEKILYLSSNLTCLECHRLDEAVNCQQANCHMASTVMAASAVEARLHYLTEKNIGTSLYRKYFGESTLGALIYLFNPKQKLNPNKHRISQKDFKRLEKLTNKLKEVIPAQHQPLLDLVNECRILTAHPKTASIDYKIAESILNLSFSFLLDPAIKITDKKLLKH